MKKNLYLLLLSGILCANASAQVFWTEDFATGCSQGTIANTYSGTNGAWTITATGANDPEANQWFVSAMENGNAAGQCGSGCGTDRSLHVGNVAIAAFGLPADNGAAYNTGGFCGSFFCVATDRRAESPTINCTGQSNITLAFNYIENGQITIDDATLWYNDGVTWTQIDPLAKPSLGACAPQGQWTAFSIVLPASANNNPNVKIGFRWVNNDDGVGTDPSFAVDDITLSATSTTPPVASFTASNTTLCDGDCISFTNTSTGGPFTATNWTFTGATPATSSAANPTNICYNTPGTYAVSLTVTDANGTDTETINSYITVNSCTTPPVASFTTANTNICAGDCISFTNTSTGGPFTATDWTFTGATPATSSAATPTNICYNTPGTYAVSLTVTDANGTDTETINGYITVTSCATAPVAAFTPSATTICAGDCISFTDNSTNTPTSWSWSFPGASTAVSTSQNPTNICYPTAGTFTVTLTATNSAGSDSQTATITVNTCATPVANFTVSDNNICEGSCITINNTSTSGTSYAWTFPGGSPASSTSASPGTICYDTPGSYSITVTVTNSSGTDTHTENITVNPNPTVTILPGDTTIEMGTPLDVEAVPSGAGGNLTFGAQTILGTQGGSITGTSFTTATVNAPNDTWVWVTYTDANGCSDTDSMFIDVNIIEFIGLPNAFSPNGDGMNDVLYVKGQGIFSFDLQIYNRYGQKVFETQSQNIGWDGTHNGKDVDPAVFVWYMNYVMDSGETGVMKGNVTLVR